MSLSICRENGGKGNQKYVSLTKIKICMTIKKLMSNHGGEKLNGNEITSLLPSTEWTEELAGKSTCGSWDIMNDNAACMMTMMVVWGLFVKRDI